MSEMGECKYDISKRKGFVEGRRFIELSLEDEEEILISNKNEKKEEFEIKIVGQLHKFKHVENTFIDSEESPEYGQRVDGWKIDDDKILRFSESDSLIESDMELQQDSLFTIIDGNIVILDDYFLDYFDNNEIIDTEHELVVSISPLNKQNAEKLLEHINSAGTGLPPYFSPTLFKNTLNQEDMETLEEVSKSRENYKFANDHIFQEVGGIIKNIPQSEIEKITDEINEEQVGQGLCK